MLNRESAKTILSHARYFLELVRSNFFDEDDGNIQFLSERKFQLPEGVKNTIEIFKVSDYKNDEERERAYQRFRERADKVKQQLKNVKLVEVKIPDQGTVAKRKSPALYKKLCDALNENERLLQRIVAYESFSDKAKGKFHDEVLKHHLVCGHIVLACKELTNDSQQTRARHSKNAKNTRDPEYQKAIFDEIQKCYKSHPEWTTKSRTHIYRIIKTKLELVALEHSHKPPCPSTFFNYLNQLGLHCKK